MLCCMQVLSETVASALQVLSKDDTVETRLFIRMMDRFFDCLNVKSPCQGIMERKQYRRPYSSPNDHRFKVLSVSCTHKHAHKRMRACTRTLTHTCTHTHTDIMGYLKEWQEQLKLKFPKLFNLCIFMPMQSSTCIFMPMQAP